MIVEPRNIGKRFLQQMDNYISLNYKNLTCQDIYDIYQGFFDELKEFRCNSHGFTGFPEFVIFRYVLQSLGGKFEVKPLTKDTKKFVSTVDERLVIGQSIRMEVKGSYRYPDILIQYDEKPVSVIAMKTVLKDKNVINEEMRNFNEFRVDYPNLNALFLLFWDVSKGGEPHQLLEKLKNTHDRNHYLILDNNDKLLSPLLDEYLELPRFKLC